MRDFLSAVVFIILFNVVVFVYNRITGVSYDHVAVWLLVGIVAQLFIKDAKND
jgi:hypothetical protein